MKIKSDFNLKSSLYSMASILAQAHFDSPSRLHSGIQIVFKANTAADTAPDSNRIPY